jgi:hypothetical protein
LKDLSGVSAMTLIITTTPKVVVMRSRKTVFLSNTGSVAVHLIKEPRADERGSKIVMAAGATVDIQTYKKDIYAYTESGTSTLEVWVD